MVESALLPDRASVNSWNPEVRLTPQFSSGTRMVWVVTPGSKVRVPDWPTKPSAVPTQTVFGQVVPL